MQGFEKLMTVLAEERDDMFAKLGFKFESVNEKIWNWTTKFRQQIENHEAQKEYNMEDIFENLASLENFGAAEMRRDSQKAVETKFVQMRLKIS